MDKKRKGTSTVPSPLLMYTRLLRIVAKPLICPILLNLSLRKSKYSSLNGIQICPPWKWPVKSKSTLFSGISSETSGLCEKAIIASHFFLKPEKILLLKGSPVFMSSIPIRAISFASTEEPAFLPLIKTVSFTKAVCSVFHCISKPVLKSRVLSETSVLVISINGEYRHFDIKILEPFNKPF